MRVVEPSAFSVAVPGKSPLDVPRAGTVQLASPVMMAAPSPSASGITAKQRGPSETYTG